MEQKSRNGRFNLSSISEKRDFFFVCFHWLRSGNEMFFFFFRKTRGEELSANGFLKAKKKSSKSIFLSSPVNISQDYTVSIQAEVRQNEPQKNKISHVM